MQPADEGAEPTGGELVAETSVGELNPLQVMEQKLSEGLEKIDQNREEALAEGKVAAEEGAKDEEHGVAPEVWARIPVNVQAKINARMQKLNAEAKAAKAEAAEAKAASSKEHAAVAQATGIPPVYFSKEEADLVSRYETLKGHKRWCVLAGKSADGYEGKEGSWTQEQIQAREAELEEELLEVAPQAVAIRRAKMEQYRKDWERGRQLGAVKPAVVTKPGSTAAAAGSSARPPVGGKAGKTGFSEAKFREEGGDRTAFEKQLEAALG